MREKMDNKKKISIGLAAVSAVVLICVVLVGMIDGVWPWEPGKGIIGEWIDPDFGKVDETTGNTEESTEPDVPETTEEESGGNKKPSKPQKPSVEEEEPTIGIDFGDGDTTTPSTDGNGTQSTDPTTEGEADGPQYEKDEEGNTGINFQDLLDKLKGDK